MKRLLLIACAVGTLASTSAMAMTGAECAAAWTKADGNSDGTLSDNEASRYFAALRVANKTVPDGKLTNASFTEHCKAGLFKSAAVEAGAPLSGANSFTESQAKDRAMATGLTNISALVKDASGVWRGTGSDGSKVMKVAVDFRGNVVTN